MASPPKADEIFAKTLAVVRRHPGILVEVKKKRALLWKTLTDFGDILNYDDLGPEIQRLRSYLETLEGVEDLEDTRPIPGLFEWEVVIDRVEAAKFGLTVGQIGHTLSVLTDGVKVGTYRPNHSRHEVEIRARFEPSHRTLTQLDHIRIGTKNGSIPLSSVAKWALFLRWKPLNAPMDIYPCSWKRMWPTAFWQTQKPKKFKWIRKNTKTLLDHTVLRGRRDKKETGIPC